MPDYTGYTIETSPYVPNGYAYFVPSMSTIITSIGLDFTGAGLGITLYRGSPPVAIDKTGFTYGSDGLDESDMEDVKGSLP